MSSARRTKHPLKELELIVREAEDKGWRAERHGRGDFTMKCLCRLHMKTVKLNPSSPLYEQELRRQLSRSTCWDN